jgi:hypothetical protein
VPFYKTGLLSRLSAAGEVVPFYKTGLLSRLSAAGEVVPFSKTGLLSRLSAAGEVVPFYKTGLLSRLSAAGEVVPFYKTGLFSRLSAAGEGVPSYKAGSFRDSRKSGESPCLKAPQRLSFRGLKAPAPSDCRRNLRFDKGICVWDHPAFPICLFGASPGFSPFSGRRTGRQGHKKQGCSEREEIHAG